MCFKPHMWGYNYCSRYSRTGKQQLYNMKRSMYVNICTNVNCGTNTTMRFCRGRGCYCCHI